MSRSIGAVQSIQELIPEWAAPIIALLTQLGDIWFLVLILGSLYWFHGAARRKLALVIGLALSGMGLYRGLKEIFEFPRPDQPLLEPELLPWMIQPLYEATAAASGYGFPSGHATNTTIVYFGLAGALAIGSRRLRYGTAAAIVATVCFTRVALGVHYLVDVVVGVALGLAFLFGVRTVLESTGTDRPTVGFGLAVLLSGFYLATTGGDVDSLALAGAALGAFAGWQGVRLGETIVEASVPSETLRPIGIHLGLGALALAPLIAALEYFPLLSAYTGAGAIGLASATIIVLPVARHSSHVARVTTALTFWLRMGARGVRYCLRPSTWRRAYRLGRQYVRQLRAWLRARWREAS